MYIKRHAVRRGRKRYVYLRLVQAYRDEQGRVRHRVLKTLGREDELKASGQLEQLMGSFARLDPPMTGVRREVGPLLLAWHFITELDLVGSVDRALPQRGRQQLSVGEAVAVLCCSRLCSPSPLYDIAGWASGAALGELLGIPAALLNDDRLGRALEILAVYAETLRGTLAARAIERFGIDAGRLHVDLTALRVCGAYERWWPRAGRRALGSRARFVRCRPQPPRGLAVRAPRARQRGRGVADRPGPRAAGRALRAGWPCDLGLRLRASQDAVSDRPLRAFLHRGAARPDRLSRAVFGRF